jgi:hypothetical protein
MSGVGEGGGAVRELTADSIRRFLTRDSSSWSTALCAREDMALLGPKYWYGTPHGTGKKMSLPDEFFETEEWEPCLCDHCGFGRGPVLLPRPNPLPCGTANEGIRVYQQLFHWNCIRRV